MQTTIKVFICFLVALFSLHMGSYAQGNKPSFEDYLCRNWRLESLSVNGKDTRLTAKQRNSHSVFRKDHTAETTTAGETQQKTWEYNAKKQAIALTDTKSDYVLEMKVEAWQNETLTLSFTDKKKTFRMHLVGAKP
jgi:hypothetical protein